ncbi:MAG: hypothetical protein M3O86_03740 [Actinomycetota bacterium]|nr:hypothetical protein [Actinomycetota bacterium]
MSAARLLPWPLHGTIEYVAGLSVIIAPFLFGFANERPAFPVFAGVGVVILDAAHPLHVGRRGHRRHRGLKRLSAAPVACWSGRCRPV